LKIDEYLIALGECKFMLTRTQKKLHVVMNMSDGSKREGTVLIDRNSRLSDVLNKADKNFVVLLDFENEVHITNKRHIIDVVELGEV
jgi:hypothetical protein